MTVAHTRISKVTFKKTGTVLRIFESKRTLISKQTRARFAASAAEIADGFNDSLAGYCIVAWNWNGECLSALKNDSECSLSTRSLPHVVAELIRSHTIMSDVEQDAVATLDDDGGA